MHSNSRPNTPIPPVTRLQKLITIVTLLMNIAIIAYIIIEWPSLPEKFPGHFNGAGEVDRWGNKGEVWILVLVNFGLWLLLTILERFPQAYNYINLTEQNAATQYRYARNLVTYLKLIITVLFSYLTIESIQIARNGTFGLAPWEMPIFLVLIFGGLGFYIFKVLRLK